MTEKYSLPEIGRMADFFAEFTLKTEGDHLVATDEWAYAPRRGNEIIEVIEAKLQEIATNSGLKVVFRCETSTLQGKKLIHKRGGYNWRDRSYEGNSVYEKDFLP